jgi:hypothetical protein
MMEKKDYFQLVASNWRRICLRVQKDEERTIRSFRNHVGLPPSQGGADGIECKRIKNRREALRAKALLDSWSFKRGSEELRIYSELLRDELQRWLKGKKLKAPYHFLLSVPVSAWSRYKTKYYPKPRMIPQLAKDLYPKSSFRLIPLPPKPRHPQRKRGYSDHGSRTPDCTLARQLAHREHIAARMMLQRMKEAYAFAIRARQLPSEREKLFYQIVRDEILEMPKNTTFETIQKIIQKVQHQASGGR